MKSYQRARQSLQNTFCGKMHFDSNITLNILLKLDYCSGVQFSYGHLHKFYY